MDLYIDKDSFLVPFQQAQQDVKSACRNATKKVEGSANRVDVAERNRSDLESFSDKVNDLITAESFDQLPSLKNRLRSHRHFRHLTVGIWRGVFLVSPDKSGVVALIFSREPHDYLNRLSELTVREAEDVISDYQGEGNDS